MPTKLVEAMGTDRPGLLSMDRVAVEGGVPILFRGQKLGGIGVSGVQSSQDAQVAQAALAAIESLLAQQSRSEEHTSELQSLMRNSYAVFCLKQKKAKPHKTTSHIYTHQQSIIRLRHSLPCTTEH